MIQSTLTEPTVLVAIAGAGGTDRRFFDYRSRKPQTSALLEAVSQRAVRRGASSSLNTAPRILASPSATLHRQPTVTHRRRLKTAPRVETVDETEGVAIALGILAGFVALVVILVCTASRPTPAHAADQTDARARAAIRA